MKKIVLTGLTVLFVLVVFSSWEYNLTTTSGDCTGANGSPGSCSPSGCHFSTTLNDLNLSIIVTDAATALPVTSYVPENNYTITIRGSHSAGGSFSAYGFQFSPRSIGLAKEGTFTPLNGDINRVVGSYLYVEHNGPIAPVSNICQRKLAWKAPKAGAGNITFYCTMLAGNGDHFATGDIDKNTSIVLTETITSVKDLGTEASITVYPNPAKDNLNLKIDVTETDAYEIAVYNLSGQCLSTETVNIQAGSFDKNLPLNEIHSGMYFLELKKGNAHKVLSFIKE